MIRYVTATSRTGCFSAKTTTSLVSYLPSAPKEIDNSIDGRETKVCKVGLPQATSPLKQLNPIETTQIIRTKIRMNPK